MAHLSISCLGGFSTTLNDEPINTFRSAKTSALLIYLAVESGRAIQRDSLIDLLWSDQDLTKANANFRQSLSRLRRILDNESADPPFVEITRQTITWNPDSDHSLDVTDLRRAVADFPTHADSEALRMALSRYHGDFLAGFFVDDAPEFEDWAAAIREEMHQILFRGLSLLADHADGAGDFSQVEDLARRQLALIPWDEAAHRRLMWALAMQEQRNEALAQYDRCFALLEDELGVEPGDETAALYEQIATGVVGAQAAEDPLPRPETPFVGRVAEISHILNTLSRPDCRVLTLVGPGGAGKTRLCLEVAHRFLAETGNAVVYVSLLGITDAAEALTALAKSLKLVVVNAGQTAQMVAAALAERDALVLLDNAESLLTADGDAFVDWLNGVVADVQQARVLVTSRHPLRSRAEWVLRVSGMALPPHTDLPPQRGLDYDAVALFDQRARQAKIGFALTQHNFGDVLRICQAVDGLPLGLELAAAQVRRRTVAEIAAALADNPADLAADLRDLPQRHRALRTVIGHSWAGLSGAEQAALARCAVFAGAFGRAAAHTLLGEDAVHLAALIEKSLVRRQMRAAEAGSPLHFLSPSLRAFLLAEHPPTPADRDRQAEFYLGWAADYPHMAAAEMANVAAAWAWAQSAESRVQTPPNWDPTWLQRVTTSPLPEMMPSSPPAHTLAGRKTELADLSAALDPLTNQHRNAGLVLITGEAGIGKSYLADALQQETTGAVWFLCPCDEVDRQSLQPIRRALRRYFAQTPGPSTDADRSAFDARFADLLHATTDAQIKADLLEARSFAAALVDIVLPDSPYMRMQPEQRRSHMQLAIRALVRAESLLQPLVIHVEDGHWLDSESRAVLDLLLRHAEIYPYAIVITARPAHFDPPAAIDAPIKTLKLEPLDVHGVTELAAARQRAAPGAALINLLMDRAGGNPFHTVQILTYLHESGLVVGGDLRAGAGHDADTPLPLDVHNVLVARLGRLDGGVRSVLAQASVLGREFPLAELSAVVGDEAAVVTALGAADAQEILKPLAGDRYQFNHALLHAAAYDSQFDAQRQDHHRRAARAIARQMSEDQPEYARIAHHWDEAGETRRAATSYLQAGNYARQNYFVREAHAYYSRGLALTQDDGERLELHLGREQVNYWLGNRVEQQVDLDELTELTAASGDSAQWAEITLRRATFALTVGEYARAVQHAQDAARLAAGRNDHRLEAQAYHRWGRALWQQGNPQAAAPLLRRALRLATVAADNFEQAQCLYDLSSLAFLEDNYALAQEQIGQALPLFEELRDKRNVIRCVNLLGLIANAQARYDTALSHYEQSLSLCRSIDWPYGEAHAFSYLGNCLFELGEFEQCRMMHLEAIALAKRLADRESEAYSLDTIGLAHQYEGNLPAARGYFEEALSVHKAIGNSRSAYTLTHLGLCLTDLEELEQASVLLYEALSLRGHSANDRASIDTKAALAWLDMARGDVELAAEQVRDVVGWLAANGMDGVELPLQVYWQCYAILRMTGTMDEAMAVLQSAHSLLQHRAGGIVDPNRRRRYLNGIIPHRQILAAWASTAAQATVG